MKQLTSITGNLIAGLVAALVCSAANAGNPSQDADAISFAEEADGSLVAYQPVRAPSADTHYRNDAALAANQCISLDVKTHPLDHTSVNLSNHCNFAVAVSYCAENEASERRCSAVGERQSRVSRIEAGAALQIEASAAVGGDEILWVACADRDHDVYSTLTQNAASGECLRRQPQLPSQVAAQIPR